MFATKTEIWWMSTDVVSSPMPSAFMPGLYNFSLRRRSSWLIREISPMISRAER